MLAAHAASARASSPSTIPSRAAIDAGKSSLRAALDLGDAGVVPLRVVVEQDVPADARRAGQLRARDVRRVAPPDAGAAVVAAVLLGRVLRVVHEQVGALGQRAQGRVDAGVVLGVRGVHEAPACVLDAVRQHAAGVVQPRDADRGLADVEAVAAPHLVHPDLGPQLVEPHGEDRRRHLAREHAGERRPAGGAAVDAELARGQVRRHEEGQALDVVPVQVREEEGGVHGALREEGVAEAADAGPGVQDQAGLAAAHLDAARVAADLRGLRLR